MRMPCYEHIIQRFRPHAILLQGGFPYRDEVPALLYVTLSPSQARLITKGR
jgi:hypothetical protein